MAEHDNTETLTHGDTPEIQKTNIGVPKDVWLAVRTASLHRGVSAQDIYVEAVRQYLGLDDKAKQRAPIEAVVKAIAEEAVAKHGEKPKTEE